MHEMWANLLIDLAEIVECFKLNIDRISPERLQEIRRLLDAVSKTSLYEELAKNLSKGWLEAFEKGFAERGVSEKIKNKDDYVIWLIQVGLFEDSAYPVGEDSPWS